MNERLYIQSDENVQIRCPHVYLQDICKLSCSNIRILNRLRILPVAELSPEKFGRYIMTVTDLIQVIQKKEPDLEIVHFGEPNFILTYEKEHVPNVLWRWAKVVFVCLASFFGAAFSIMTFNNDVNVGGLFSQIYTQVTGQPPSGFTILEIS